mmetsp:Transcript_37493/g.89111  ORF Transcript_37493/g.89111 Transcript_37493/m.89111 type:complete len:317 (+) Transcript_37493:329-1279(+)
MPHRVAIWIAVSPPSLAMVSSAPKLSSSRTVSRCPRITATMRGVKPPGNVWSMTNPPASSRRHSLRSLRPAATWMGAAMSLTRGPKSRSLRPSSPERSSLESAARRGPRSLPRSQSLSAPEVLPERKASSPTGMSTASCRASGSARYPTCASGAPLSASHTVMLAPSAQVSSSGSSAAAHAKGASGPGGSRISRCISPVAASQRRTLRSSEAVAAREPRSKRLSAVTRPSWAAVRWRYRLLAGCPPSATYHACSAPEPNPAATTKPPPSAREQATHSSASPPPSPCRAWYCGVVPRSPPASSHALTVPPAAPVTPQ